MRVNIEYETAEEQAACAELAGYVAKKYPKAKIDIKEWKKRGVFG